MSDSKKNGSRVVVETRSRAGVTYQLEYVRCGRKTCGRCATEATHGPYWYAYRWNSTLARVVSTYIGRDFAELPPEKPKRSAWPTIRNLGGR
jgi:hypothetical protein